MTATLIVSSNSAGNPLTLDLSKFLRLSDGEGMDPQDPVFSEKVFARSLLREGATLALESFHEKELLFPLALNAPSSAVTNLFTQPTVRYGLGGWKTSGFGALNAGAAASVVTDAAAPSGARQAVQVVTTNALASEGIALQFPGTFQSGQAYSVSGFIRGNAGGEPARIGAASAASGDSGATGTLAPTTGYQRFSFTYTPASTHTDLYVFVNTATATACTFFLDAVQVTLGSALATYTDGDELGCMWNGPPGSSTSTAPGGLSQSITMVEQLNQAVTTPGATFSWQDTGLSQPTVFDGISGQFDVEYSYRQHEKFWVKGKLRLFAQPLGRTASPRLYATASGVGPLLMISPYASGGALTIGASTQAGVAGFGGQQQGASSGVFYWGSPDLAGDAQAQLQISYVGPRPTGASQQGLVPYAFVSILPDRFYTPLIPAFLIGNGGGNIPQVNLAGSSQVIGSQYMSYSGFGTGFARFQAPWGASAGIAPTLAWAGSHRILALARASRGAAYIWLSPGPTTPAGQPTTTVLPGGDWQVYDLGVYSLRASEYPTTQVIANISIPSALGATTSGIDLNAFITLPDNATWALNPVTLQGSQYGRPPQVETVGGVPFTNTLLMDDVLGDQFIFSGQAQTSAPSPLGGAGASSARITQFSRGLIPRPDPKGGVPIIALVGLGQWGVASSTATFFGASWANPTNLTTLAQVNVLERTRYILP